MICGRCSSAATLVGVRRSRKALRQSWSKTWESQLVGRRVESVHRRGKWLLVGLDGGAFLMVHLGMTGRFTVVAPAAETEPHTHLVFPLDNAHELRFRDARRFGSVTYFPGPAGLGGVPGRPARAGAVGHVAADVASALKGTKRPVKAVLMDQTVVAGVGNIYADEACFAARIDPRRAGNTVATGRRGPAVAGGSRRS